MALDPGDAGRPFAPPVRPGDVVTHGWTRALAATALAVILVAAIAVSAQAVVNVKLVSRANSGVPANGMNYVDDATAISRDGGVIAFQSNGANLPGGDGTTFEIYARNLQTGTTRLMSKKANGDAADGNLQAPAISADGRFVAFYGPGDGLPGSDGVTRQVWLADRKTGDVRLVSKNNSGKPAAGYCSYPSVSGDGRYVIFAAAASNLPGGDGANELVYVRDMKLAKTILVSRTRSGEPAFGSDVFGQSISTDGRRVIFESDAANLPAGSGPNHIYVRNLGGDRVSLVDRNNKGRPVGAYYPSISGNGRYVGFDAATNHLPPGDASRQAYLRDLRTDKTILLGKNNNGTANNGQSYYPHPSGSGRRVVFVADGTNLPGGNGKTQIYVRDLARGKTILMSEGDDDAAANLPADGPSISLDGRFAIFYSEASNLPGARPGANVYRSGPVG